MATRAEMLTKLQVEKGVDALLAVLKKKEKESAVSLVEYPDKIDLQFTLKKITYKQRKILPLSLPHSIHHKSREVCLFVKDLDQKNREYENTVEHYEELFKTKKVTDISKIVPIKALKTDYSEFSSKRVLAQAYDLYLADACVFGVLPALLGQAFFKKKRTVPIQVNLQASNLKVEVERVVNNTRCVITPSGSCHMVTVAHSWLSRDEIVDNVLAAANQLLEKVHGQHLNVRNINIKTDKTCSIPLVVNLSDPVDFEIDEPKAVELEECVDDITTVEDGLVRIRADGHIEILKDNKSDIKLEGKAKTKKAVKVDVKVENKLSGKRQRKRGRGNKDSNDELKSKKIKVNVKEEKSEIKKVSKVTAKVSKGTGVKAARLGKGVKTVKSFNKKKGGKQRAK